MKNTVRYYRNIHTKGLSTPTLWILALCFLGCQGAVLVEKQQGVINSRNVDLSRNGLKKVPIELRAKPST